MDNISKVREYFREHNASIFDLDAINAMLDELGHPEEGMKIVHITGTNGKGSAGAYLANILMASGLRVGQFASPAVMEPNEIIKVDNECISDEDIVAMFEVARRAVDNIVARGVREPTAFEMQTCMAFIYFLKRDIDIAVIEVGMGGAMDSTNVIKDTMVEMVTRISYDHMGILGKTLKEIATTKAGIIKDNSTIITTMQDDEVMRVLSREAEKHNATLIVAGDGMQIGGENHRQTILYKGREYDTRLLGKYQIYNLPVAVETARELRRRGYDSITDTTILEGVARTILPGRFEIIGEEPLFILDGAHNDEASNMLHESMDCYFKGRRIVYVLGIFKDKDVRKILDNTIALADEVITFDWDNPRHMPGEELASMVSEYMSNVRYAGDIEGAVRMALEDSDRGDVVVAFGSLSHLGDIKRAYKGVVNNGR